MKNILLTALIAGLCCSCNQDSEATPTTIQLKNPSEYTLTSKLIHIDKGVLPKSEDSAFPILMDENDTIPAQPTDTDGDGTWDRLVLVMDFKPSESKTLTLGWTDELPEFEKKTSVRFGVRNAEDEPVKPATEETLTAEDMPKNSKLGFQKYQTDGPTWENDKVAFRHYLDGRHAKDVYGKKTAAISPENVGLDSAGAVVDNYHQMEDWGRDVFPVGNSVGLGGFTLMIDGQPNRLGALVNDTVSNIANTTFKIIEEGPVLSKLQYNYNGWEVTGNTYQAQETTTIWPGMYAYKNEVSIEGLQESEMLGVGLSNINNQNGVEEIIGEKWIALVQHDSLTYDRTWVMGTALILPKGNYQGYTEAPETGKVNQTYLAQFKIDNGQPVTYYAVAGWELSQEPQFKDAAFFKQYVVDLANQIYTDIEVEVVNPSGNEAE